MAKPRTPGWLVILPAAVGALVSGVIALVGKK